MNDPEFRDFAAAQMESLRGLAYLTCGDWQAAEDVVLTVPARVYGRWSRIERPDSYARTAVVRAAIDRTRRPWWRRERSHSHDSLPEASDAQSGGEAAPVHGLPGFYRNGMLAWEYARDAWAVVSVEGQATREQVLAIAAADAAGGHPRRPLRPGDLVRGAGCGRPGQACWRYAYPLDRGCLRRVRHALRAGRARRAAGRR